VSGPPAEPATEPQASRRHAGRRSLPPSISFVAAAVAPRRSWHVKPAAAYTKDVRRTLKTVPDHHELPRYYLRGFLEPDTHFLWAFRADLPFKPGTKYGDNPRRQGLRQTGIRPDGYVAWHRDGKRHFDYELRLQKKERAADQAIAKVRSFDTITTAEKEILARYIGLMWRRVGERDEQIRPMLEKQLATSRLQKDAWRYAVAGRVDDARGVLDELAWMRSPEGKVDLLRETMVSDFNRVHAILMGLRWTFQRAAPSGYFVTSDVPVTYDRSAGLRRSPLLFPISRDVMITGTMWGREDLAWSQCTAAETRKFNEIVITMAKHEVFSPLPDEWIHSSWTRLER
jgi:hypothetical protein